MTQEERTAFIKNGMEALYREFEAADPIYLKSPGVPEEMRAGPADESGWYKWKLVPSRVTEADLDGLEKEIGCRLPGLMRTFLSTCYCDFRDAELCRQRPDKPFETIQNAWNPILVRAGFLPFGWDKNADFICCIDLENMPDEDRCPVVQIDHEVLFDLGETADREALLPHMEPVAPSFRAFLEEIFSGYFAKRGREAAREYLEGLREAFDDAGLTEKWEEFTAIAQGVSDGNLAKLKALYPELPAGLETLLRFADGTYYREYPKGTADLLILGSDMEEFPYYLLSARQMMDTKDDFARWGDYLINREYEDCPVSEGICRDMASLRFLHFADCCNNGGSSQLFIDFSPSEKGKSGQIVRYTHDPDELEIIADDFDDYLHMLMVNGYDFVHEDDD